MAGREASGFASGDAALFTGCAWVLCLDEGVGLDDWLTVAELITDLGARVVPATTEEHDRAVAAISHVPHLLASALAANAADDLLGADPRRRLVPGRDKGCRHPAGPGGRDVRRERDRGQAGPGTRDPAP